MPEEEFFLKKLEMANLDQVSRFRMAKSEDRTLQDFIRRKAKNSGAANLTQTYVAKIDGDKRVIGYISLMCAEVKLDKTYPITEKPRADDYESQPAVRIARLAIESEHQGKRIGRALVELAIGITKEAIMPNAGCRFLILDAKQKSISFYEKNGFRLLKTEENMRSEAPTMFMDLQKLDI